MQASINQPQRATIDRHIADIAIESANEKQSLINLLDALEQASPRFTSRPYAIDGDNTYDAAGIACHWVAIGDNRSIRPEGRYWAVVADGRVVMLIPRHVDIDATAYDGMTL